MLANHFVIEELLKKWKSKKAFAIEFEKFSKRYPEDNELQKLYTEMKSGKNLDELKKKLEKLYKERKALDPNIEADNLPYASRRRF